jgi:peptide/nickel transport system permease protein
MTATSVLAPARAVRLRTAVTLAALLVLIVTAPHLAPNDPEQQFADRNYAPPMLLHVWDGTGVRAPFVYPQALVDRTRRQYRDRLDVPTTVAWFANGRIASTDTTHGPLLLLGGDALGRDVFSRLVHGARLSLGVALAGVLLAVLIGAAIGAVAGASGGVAERVLMLAADFVIVLPGAYLVLVLRGILPPVLSTTEIFALMTVLFAFAAWPYAARGVRAIVAVERHRDYVEAARAAGAGRWRLARHVLPAARGFLAVQIGLLLPALLVAEATLSYLGFGFPERVPSWGTMLQDAASVRVMSEAPWLLAPAVALFLVVLTVQAVTRATPTAVAVLLQRREK